MADNYLEKRMEEYRAGKLSSRSHRPIRSISLKRPSLPPLRVFVTGGACGIGRAIVRAFRDEGCYVAFCDNDLNAGRTTAQSTGAQFYPLDVTDPDALEGALDNIVSRHGDIDVIINNVGICQFKPLTETSVEDFDRTLATNLRPVFLTARFLARHRSTLDTPNNYGGRIINISSTRATMSETDTTGYSASKGGVNALTHSLMMSLSPWRITVNAISPGWIETGDYTKLSENDHTQHPSQRVGRPEDIARMAVFISHPDNNFINGEIITIDGGMTHKMIYV